MHITISLMGGSIDSFWDTRQRKRSPNRHSVIPDAFLGLGIENSTFTSLCLKDGRDIDINDCQKLATNILNSADNHHIVIIGAEAAADVYDFLQSQENSISCVFWCPLEPRDQAKHGDEVTKLIAVAKQGNSGIFFDNMLLGSDTFREQLWNGLLVSYTMPKR